MAHDLEDVVRENFRLVEDADLGAIAESVAPDFVNHRAVNEPLAARSHGPDGMAGTVIWLNRAFTDIRFDLHETARAENRLAVRVTMNVRQHGPFVVYDSPDGAPTQVFPSLGRSCAVAQTHWFTIEDGLVAEHDAVRDDLSMAEQLGWLPPGPAYLLKMRRALRAERRSLRSGH